jgi:hypothetical protein
MYQRSEEEQFEAETEIGISATRFKAAQRVREAKEIGAITPGEWEWGASLTAER